MKNKKNNSKKTAVKAAVSNLLTATGITTAVRIMCCCTACPCC